MTNPEPRPPTVNLPNALTTLRLFLVPVFLWLLLANNGSEAGYRIAAAALFLFASVTDFVDGALARRKGLVTTFGKIADPIADKALTGAALIGLSLLGELPWWISIVILVREVGVTLLRFLVLSDAVIPASRGGKAKTVSQMTAILLYLLPLSGWLLTVRDVVMGVAVFLTVATGLDYGARAIAVRRHAELRREAFGDQG
ncbi:MAG: CDP-diacylglycerol--glycerol-3-phosphate 3-phosphatidyltransferase [Candidatus Nanopelagicales bacterium]|nr:CDP-diacylglycerol--glycerol-3-phosphate 3-phosphatidyltransferase [Candidatus Nanopelagicales bacterium]